MKRLLPDCCKTSARWCCYKIWGNPTRGFSNKPATPEQIWPRLERHTLGFDHLALSGLLLQAWGLPEPLTQAVTADLADEPGSAHSSSIDRPSELAKILHLAHLLTMLMTGPPADLLARLLSVGARYRGLRHEQLLQLVESLEDKVSQLAGVLTLELPSGVRYSELLIRAKRNWRKQPPTPPANC